MTKVALITGGNGITGSAILEYFVSTTTASEWSQIIVTSRSPFKTTVHDDRIIFIALDLSKDPGILIDKMCAVCGSVTHAYFSSYVHKDDFKELNMADEKKFFNFLDSLIAVVFGLENCTLQTGGKYHNVHLGPVPSSAREEDPRTGSSIANFYYPQEDYLVSRQKDQQWNWNIVRPEAIIGHTSKPNGMNSALTYALYFLASTSKNAANQSFNVTNGDYFTWRYMWPRIASYNGASATPDQVFTKPRPAEGETQLDISLAEWTADKQEVGGRICDKHSCPEAKLTWESGTWMFQDCVFQRTWSATLSINKARSFGWTGYIDSFQSLTDAFDKFVELKQIPKFKPEDYFFSIEGSVLGAPHLQCTS